MSDGVLRATRLAINAIKWQITVEHAARLVSK
jgi:hypothetical protein